MDPQPIPQTPTPPPPSPAVVPNVSGTKEGQPTPPPKPKHPWLLPVVALMAVLLFGAATFYVYRYILPGAQPAVATFEACTKATGSKIQESYPPVCVTRDGNRFTQPLTEEEKQNLQPPDPTADLSRDVVLRNWKTYTNSRYGYSLKYPSDWEIINWGVGIVPATPDSYDIALRPSNYSWTCANNPGVFVIEETADPTLSVKYLIDTDLVNPKKILSNLKLPINDISNFISIQNKLIDFFKTRLTIF